MLRCSADAHKFPLRRYPLISKGARLLLRNESREGIAFLLGRTCSSPSEGGRTDEPYLEGIANLPSAGVIPHHSSVNEAFVRNLTWRFRAAAAQERECIEQELQVARQIQQELLPETIPKLPVMVCRRLW